MPNVSFDKPMIQKLLNQIIAVNTGPWGTCILAKKTRTERYARVSDGAKRKMSHRAAYELAYGEIPPGLDLDHLCRQTNCINPLHLEPVTNSENQKRGYASRDPIKACKHGHLYTPETTYLTKEGHRSCIICRREAGIRGYNKKKQLLLQSKVAGK